MIGVERMIGAAMVTVDEMITAARIAEETIEDLIMTDLHEKWTIGDTNVDLKGELQNMMIETEIVIEIVTTIVTEIGIAEVREGTIVGIGVEFLI
jgi:hypothetical protein